MLNISKFIFLFIGVWFTVVNTSKIIIGEKRLSAGNLFYQALGVSGFVFLQWII